MVYFPPIAAACVGRMRVGWLGRRLVGYSRILAGNTDLDVIFCSAISLSKVKFNYHEVIRLL